MDELVNSGRATNFVLGHEVDASLEDAEAHDEDAVERVVVQAEYRQLGVLHVGQ